MNRSIPIALCMAVAVLEGFDIQAMGVAAPRLAPEFGLGAREMGWVFSINNIGMVLGAALGGWLADRVGRKPVFLGAVAMFGLFTLAVVVTRDFQTLLAVRVLAGLGFGAALPNMMAIATELSDPARRSSTAALIFCGFPLGGGTVALLTQVLPSSLDWRALFIMGGLLPALLVPVLHKFLPETLTRQVRASQTSRVPVFKALFGEGRALPSLLLLLGRMVDRLGPRWPLTLSYVGLIGALMLLGAATDHTMVILLSAAAGFFLLGANYALYGVAPAYYPTAMRGTGSGASVAVGRVGSVLGPLVAGIMLAGGSSAMNVVQYMAPVAAVAGLAVCVLSFYRRE